jgi:hypothetical protein
MRTNIILGLVLIVFSSYSQCLTSKHINIANKVFEGKLKANDFDGNLFITIDTVNAESPNVPSLYFEFSKHLNFLLRYDFNYDEYRPLPIDTYYYSLNFGVQVKI